MSHHEPQQPDSSDEPAGSDTVPVLESSPPLAAESVCFAGRLASMTHEEAGHVVEQAGGVATASVTRETTLLVVGESGLPLEHDGRVSRKIERAWQLREAGQPLRLLKETDWLQLTGLAESHNTQRTCTPAVLSQLLDIPVSAIRRWERLGLIRPVKKVGRLPWYSFQEVTAARRLIELHEQGVSPGLIQSGLEQLARLFPDVERPLVQLELLASGGQMLVRDAAGLVNVTSGQRSFDFAELESSPPSADNPGSSDENHLPDVLAFVPRNDAAAQAAETESGTRTPADWYETGCRLSDENHLPEAAEAFRICLMDFPDHAEAHFRLGDVLHRMGRPEAALERYCMAVAVEHDYLEAWTLLGSVYAETGEPETALDAFQAALLIAPNCPETLYQQAQVLAAAGRAEAAAASYRSFLEQEQDGPWAESARDWLAGFSGGPQGQST
ncbi:MAG: tetratricopeptide repeat protein [Planctomycetaceae bacterium]|nr:tetratricopeptide repeat protein [Planctomycetaceae bacterium]